jgi:hypothetical protein
MNRQTIIDELMRLNKSMTPTQSRVFADTMLAYMEASRDIAKNGAIVAHPRTGAPMENPYTKIMKIAGDGLSKRRILTGDLWDRLDEDEQEE